MVEGRCKGESEPDKDCGEFLTVLLDTSSLARYTIKNESAVVMYGSHARMIQVDAVSLDEPRAFVWILA